MLKKIKMVLLHIEVKNFQALINQKNIPVKEIIKNEF